MPREIAAYALHVLPALFDALPASPGDSIFDAAFSMERSLNWEAVVRGMEAVYPLLQNAVAILVCYWIGVLLPMSVFRRTHRWIAGSLQASSLFIGVVCWCHALTVAYRLLGWLATAMGLLCGGIGVVPAALFATAREKDWNVFANILIMAAIAVGARMVAKLMLGRAPRTRLVLRSTHHYNDDYNV